MVTPGLQIIQPWIWQYAWPHDIQNELVSYTNSKGRLTINDLELAGLVLGWLVMEYVVDNMKFKHIRSFCDNTSVVSQTYRGSTSTSILAARIRRLISLQ